MTGMSLNYNIYIYDTTKTIKIDEVEYIRVDAVKQKAEQVDRMDYVIVRTYSAGVHAGYLKEKRT